jgi:hypothetical protein
MVQETTPAAIPKTRNRIWLPIVACPLGYIVGRYVGKYTFAAFGFQIPQAPFLLHHPEMTWLYDGRMAGGNYGGVGAVLAGLIIMFVGRRWNPWLALAASLAGGALFAAFGAVIER